MSGRMRAWLQLVLWLVLLAGGLSDQQDPPHLQDDEVVQVETLETKDGEIDVKEEPESQPLENSGAEENETSPPPVEGTAFDASDQNETSEANVTAQSKDYQDSSNNTTEATGGKASSPASTPVVQRRVRCLKKRVVFNVSEGVEGEAGMSLEEKSREIQDQLEPKVQVVNASHLLQVFSEAHNPNVTNRSMGAECHLVMFYAPWCPFSAQAAPHFNGLARAFPDIGLYAVDSSKSQGGINTQFGILAIPTVVLFHNTRQVTKFNQTEYLIDKFADFVEATTFLERSIEAYYYDEHHAAAEELAHIEAEAADQKSDQTSSDETKEGSTSSNNISNQSDEKKPRIRLWPEDMEGPVPTKAVPQTDYLLWLAWSFTLVCAVGYLAKSSYCQRVIESIRNNWREAEIQHEHID